MHKKYEQYYFQLQVSTLNIVGVWGNWKKVICMTKKYVIIFRLRGEWNVYYRFHLFCLAPLFWYYFTYIIDIDKNKISVRDINDIITEYVVNPIRIEPVILFYFAPICYHFSYLWTHFHPNNRFFVIPCLFNTHAYPKESFCQVYL